METSIGNIAGKTEISKKYRHTYFQGWHRKKNRYTDNKNIDREEIKLNVISYINPTISYKTVGLFRTQNELRGNL